MIEGKGSSNDTESNRIDNTEQKSSFPEKMSEQLGKATEKLNELFKDDLTGLDEQDSSIEDTRGKEFEREDTSEPEKKADTSEGNSSSTIDRLFEKLFESDLPQRDKDAVDSYDNKNETGSPEKHDPVLERIVESIGTPEGIRALIEKHPEKAELWKTQLEAIEILNDPDASPAEKNSAQKKLSNLKGQLLETAVKDALTEAGFDVESQQRVVEGESGGTRPDVIARNNTDHPIEVFGVTIQPDETLSVECKCGCAEYIKSQLNNHIPNQLSGQEGTKVLLTTSDIKETPDGLAASVCDKYGATLVITTVSVADVENAIKEASEA